jgi:5-(carboxyamino)imidazole ribonucleotide mutase
MSDTQPAKTKITRSKARRAAMSDPRPLVGVVMGSRSDWETMKVASDTLRELGVAHEALVVSAHRTPDWLFEYAESAEDRGLMAIVAGAGGAAHLPGMLASKTIVPIFGVPVQSKALSGMDSLLSIVQMPGGVPVATLAIGPAGAKNAALLAAALVGIVEPKVREALRAMRSRQTDEVMESHVLV